MKKYVCPVINEIALKSEENIASIVQTCNGACTFDIDYNKDGKIDYYAHGS
jgi:hypothetical protein